MTTKPMRGQHHVSAITANAKENYYFYTKVLGLRLVKKSVNQDDTSVYHLFYADERGNPGTDLTFFEFPQASQARFGTNSISATSLRVPSDESLRYWQDRFKQYGVEQDDIIECNGRASLSFRDPEGQRLILVSDENNTGVDGGKPWDKSPVPSEHGIYGLGPVSLSVSRLEPTANILTNIMGFRKKGKYEANEQNQAQIHVYETGEGGTGAEVHVQERTDIPLEMQGSGSVHHVAFRVDNEEELERWLHVLNESRIPNSGLVERYYFRSLYFREPNGILFELATDGPGFEGDESFEHLGEKLALPPYFENQRESIEAKLKPLETKE